MVETADGGERAAGMRSLKAIRKGVRQRARKDARKKVFVNK